MHENSKDMMHENGRDMMKTHPIYIEIDNRKTHLIDDLTELVPGDNTGVGFPEFSKRLSKFCGISLRITITDGDLPGIGCYIFFKNNIDAMEFKLRFV